MEQIIRVTTNFALHKQKLFFNFNFLIAALYNGSLFQKKPESFKKEAAHKIISY